jgi:hypothetical protein
MIKERRKIDEVEPWLEAQLEAAAMNWQMVAKLHDELESNILLSYENGSQGQTKAVANPLLTMYKEMQRTHILHMEALGLNYKTLPSKMKESVSNVSEDDPLVKFYEGFMGTQIVPKSVE